VSCVCFVFVLLRALWYTYYILSQWTAPPESTARSKMVRGVIESRFFSFFTGIGYKQNTCRFIALDDNSWKGNSSFSFMRDSATGRLPGRLGPRKKKLHYNISEGPKILSVLSRLSFSSFFLFLCSILCAFMRPFPRRARRSHFQSRGGSKG